MTAQQHATTTAKPTSNHNHSIHNMAPQPQQQRITKRHLAAYLVLNPSNASFASWLAACRPNAVKIQIDSRFTIPSNPWLTVYEQAWTARYGMVPLTKQKTQEQQLRHAAQRQMPTRFQIKFNFVTSSNEEANIKTWSFPIPSSFGNARIAPLPQNKTRDDIAAEQQVWQAKRAGLQVIRQHLEAFLELHPRASFEAWIATLHPENATVTILDAHLTKGQNPVRQLFEEAQAVQKRQQKQKQQQQQPQQATNIGHMAREKSSRLLLLESTHNQCRISASSQ